MEAQMCSVDPREPPPHFTLAGSFFICSTTSFMVLRGESAGTTNTLYSLVRRAMGVILSMPTWGLPVMMPPTITAPVMIKALASPLAALTNCARPITPAAPPLFSYCTVSATLASSKALPSSRPVPSQPPPGLAGIIIFTLAPAWALKGYAPAAAKAARDFRKWSRRMECSLRGLVCGL